jgi:hypothetical protein
MFIALGFVVGVFVGWLVKQPAWFTAMVDKIKGTSTGVGE